MMKRVFVLICIVIMTFASCHQKEEVKDYVELRERFDGKYRSSTNLHLRSLNRKSLVELPGF